MLKDVPTDDNPLIQRRTCDLKGDKKKKEKKIKSRDRQNYLRSLRPYGRNAHTKSPNDRP